MDQFIAAKFLYRELTSVALLSLSYFVIRNLLTSSGSKVMSNAAINIWKVLFFIHCQKYGDNVSNFRVFQEIIVVQ